MVWLVTTVLALIPAFLWAFIFYQKDKVSRHQAWKTFVLGAISVTPILLYKELWDVLPAANIFTYTNTFEDDLLSFVPHLYLPLGAVFGFMFVGVIEEYMKHIVVVKADQGFFRNIDDAIEFSILAALGFAFIENILYFTFIWQFQGGDMLMMAFIFRALFSTFAHILFSGIYGYYYGVSVFADPIWSEKQRKQRHPFIQFFHKLSHLKSSRIFALEKRTEGLMLAVLLHAAFNLMLEMNFTFFMVPFLVFGYLHLDKLFQRKENLKAYGHLTGEASPHKHAHHWLWKNFSPETVRAARRK